jgi:hypothetical protein
LFFVFVFTGLYWLRGAELNALDIMNCSPRLRISISTVHDNDDANDRIALLLRYSIDDTLLTTVLLQLRYSNDINGTLLAMVSSNGLLLTIAGRR